MSTHAIEHLACPLDTEMAFFCQTKGGSVKLCLAKMKFVHDVTSDTAEQTGLLHQGQLKLDWTFIYERGSGKKKRASINVTGEYSTTCVDYVMVFGDSKLHIPVNQYTDLRSTCDVTDFAQSVPICISAYKAFYKRIHNNETFKKAMQQKCSDNPYINVYTTMAFGIALSREYKGNHEVYSLKKSPLAFSINKLFEDLSNQATLKMRCEEEAVTFTVFARLLGKKDINIVCSPNHAWVETSPGKCKYDISTFVPNDNPNDDTHMEIDELSELSELSGLKTEHDPIILK